MIVKIDRSFERDTRKIKDGRVLKNIADCIEGVQTAKKIADINDIKKLRGFRNAYRIKIGEYRLGLLITGNTAHFIRCLHRKDIYRYFPK